MSFDASTLGSMSLVSQIGGGVTSAIGGYYGARSQASALKGQAKLAEINARIADLGAESVLEQGKQESARLTLRAGQLKGAQRAGMAANGVDLGVGSAAEVQASTDLMKEIDANTIRSNAVRGAWGHRTQASNYRNEAYAARASASGISPMGTVASSLLGSATSVATSWYGMQKDGVFDSAAQYDSIDHLATESGWW